MPQYWDAHRVLNLYQPTTEDLQCIGYAKTRGRRCRLTVKDFESEEANKILNNLGRARLDDLEDDPQLETLLRNIASLTLCQRWHRKVEDPSNCQIGNFVRRWKDQIREEALRQSEQQVRRTAQTTERPHAAAAPSVSRAAPHRHAETVQTASSSLASTRTQPRPIQAPPRSLPTLPPVAAPVPAQLPTPPETPRETPPREAAAAAALRRHDQTPTRSSRHASDLSSGTTEHRLERTALPTPPPESSEARLVAANRRQQQAIAVTEVETQTRAQRSEPTTPTRSHLPSPPASPLAVESPPVVFGASLPSVPTHQFTFSAPNNITEHLSANMHTEYTATPEVPTTPQRTSCTRSHRATRRSIPADCAICHDPLTDSHSIVWCKAQCGKNLHRSCWDTWVASLTPPRGHSRPRNLRCVWCRSSWDSEACPCDDEAPPVEPPTPGELGIAYLDLHNLPQFIAEHISRLASARSSGSSSSSPIRVETGVGERSGEVTLTLSL